MASTVAGSDGLQPLKNRRVIYDLACVAQKNVQRIVAGVG
jgi:hypothetical protein